MSNPEDSSELLDGLSVPMGDLISNVGRSLAEAQQALDAQAIENFRRIYTEDGGQLAALRELGYRPTWYHIPELTAEIKVALSISSRRESSSDGYTQRTPRVYAVPTDATYTNRFDFNLEASSKIAFRIVPVPAPEALESLKIVPALTGKTLREARRLLDTLGLSFSVDDENAGDDAKVQAQSPEPGATLDRDEEIRLTTKGGQT